MIFAIFVSSFILPAASFENDVETSTADMLLINTDTDTVVFSQKPDNMWYAGTLAELMTFLLAYESISDLDGTTFKVEQTFIKGLPYTDGCLDKFVGQTLTAKDLMSIMLLTSGSDAAYALASLANNGDTDAFVADMNARAEALGCTNTGYVSPGFNDTSDQYTTCRDLYRLYTVVDKIELYNKIMQMDSFTPAGLDEGDYTVDVEISILNENSPYYFRYVNDAQYSYSKATYAGIALTTTYRGKNYFYAGLLGLNESERNAYADARKLTTWAYQNLSDRKMINEEDALYQVEIKGGWGEYMVDLHPRNSAFKTLPNEYDESKLTYSFDVPESVETPVLGDQAVGRAKISYDGNEIDDIALYTNTDEGLGMLSDAGRFASYVLDRLTPNQYYAPDEEEELQETAQPAEKETEASTQTAATAATEG
ncbi:MAG: D-alanyl-D-alanine carboxypeptidase [Ruminococcus sp.]|nr:D-alanyl-D-alanine carboxypeptidase [Ruminococcus sp.]